MCQNQGQTIYTRNARTRIVAIKLNMPQPFLCVGARLVHTSEFSPREMGAVTTSFHFKRLYRPRSRSGRSSTRTKREQIARAITQQDTFHLKSFESRNDSGNNILNPKLLLR